MAKIIDRLGCMNTFLYYGIEQYYMVYRSQNNWHYEWSDVDGEIHRSVDFATVEDVIKDFVRVEKDALRNTQNNGQCYPDEEMFNIILNKIANAENPDTKAWLLGE